MSLKIQRIIEDLSDSDSEIQTLALTTVTRISFDDGVTQQELQILRRKVNELCTGPNGDIAFLAKKAANYMDAGGRQTQSISREALAGAVARSQAAPQQPAAPPPPPAAGRQLVAELVRETDTVKIASILANLRRCTDPSVLADTSRFLSHSDDRVRANAVEVFEDLGDKRHIPLLVPLLNDENNRVRSNVVKALGRFGDPHVKEYLASMLDSDKVAMRESAVYAIAQLSKLDLEDLLVRAASDAYEGVRLRAVKCLADCTGERAVAAITRRIDDNDPTVRQQAIEILAAKGVDIRELLKQRQELGLNDASSNMPYIPTPPAKATPEDEEFQARVREKVERTFKREILNIAQELREAEVKATLSRLLFKIGVDGFELCRRGELKDKALMVHYYEITRYQDYLRSLSHSLAPDGELKTQILTSGLDQYRAKMRASFVRMGKAIAQAYRNKTVAIAETPELRAFAKILQ